MLKLFMETGFWWALPVVIKGDRNSDPLEGLDEFYETFGAEALMTSPEESEEFPIPLNGGERWTTRISHVRKLDPEEEEAWEIAYEIGSPVKEFTDRFIVLENGKAYPTMTVLIPEMKDHPDPQAWVNVCLRSDDITEGQAYKLEGIIDGRA